MAVFYNPDGSVTQNPNEVLAQGPTVAARNQNQFDSLLATANKYRQQDLAQGQERGQEIFGTPLIDQSQKERSADMTDIINRRRAMLGGYSPQDMQSFADQGSNSINQATQNNMRTLQAAQARSGARGATAAANQARVVQQGNIAQGQQNQDLFLKNEAMKRASLDNYQNTIQGAEKTETQRAGQQQFGQLGTELGYASLGAGERGAIGNQLIGQAQAQAAASAANRGGKK